VHEQLAWEPPGSWGIATGAVPLSPWHGEASGAGADAWRAGAAWVESVDPAQAVSQAAEPVGPQRSTAIRRSRALAEAPPVSLRLPLRLPLPLPLRAMAEKPIGWKGRNLE
jgi:hypothetical protein